ncbi:MAG TPA: hypothetical protein VIW27_09125, partial [Gammaproteobacteria bacterium]
MKLFAGFSVDTIVMRHKILILNLLLALVLLPVTQAMSPDAAPAEHDHASMVMDCGHVDPGHCIDFASCVSGSHASCDTNLKAAQVLPKSADLPGALDLAEHFLS